MQSTVTARTDDDVSFSELGMSECESAAADTISTRSVTSYQSSRSGLTRQGISLRMRMSLFCCNLLHQREYCGEECSVI